MSFCRICRLNVIIRFHYKHGIEVNHNSNTSPFVNITTEETATKGKHTERRGTKRQWISTHISVEFNPFKITHRINTPFYAKFSPFQYLYKCGIYFCCRRCSHLFIWFLLFFSWPCLKSLTILFGFVITIDCTLKFQMWIDCGRWAKHHHKRWIFVLRLIRICVATFADRINAANNAKRCFAGPTIVKWPKKVFSL